MKFVDDDDDDDEMQRQNCYHWPLIWAMTNKKLAYVFSASTLTVRLHVMQRTDQP